MHWIFITYLFLRDIHEGILSTEDAFREQGNSFCKLKNTKKAKYQMTKKFFWKRKIFLNAREKVLKGFKSN